MIRSLPDLFSKGTWSSALFTTYALSLSFFETVVLRELQRRGCRDIVVLVDRKGYADSLIERRSGRVGQEYRVVPAALPEGIFHAKLAWVEGEDEDLLAIGSGNITFGGYGRNLEVIEIFSSARDRWAFAGIADVLVALAHRPDLILPEAPWLEDRLDRALRFVSGTTRAETDRRIVHSVERPILTQLVEIARNPVSGVGRVERLTVLSPYFDADGAAVRRFAEEVGAPALCIGLPTNPAECSRFPFGAAATWGPTIEAVRPKVEDPDRRLHAKWMLIEGTSGSVTLTGSVNATTASLATNR